MGNIRFDCGEIAACIGGENNTMGAKGNANAMHISAFESAPPNPPV
jgi:hypothetical protein